MWSRPSAVTPAANGVPVIQAPLLDAGVVAHAFTTRRGGISPAPYDTLNLGRATGDERDHIVENRTRALRAVGSDLAAQVEASQIHGRDVAVVTRAHRGAKIARVDGLVTAQPGVVLAIHAADCVPILFWDADRHVVGAAHAGWRGTAAGVAAAVVETMARDFGSHAGDLWVAMGPAIGVDHYTVGPEVEGAFRRWPWSGEALTPVAPGRWRLDLVAANRRILEGLGVAPEHIWAANLCTACHPDLFFSYRRDRTTGRQAGIISLV